MEREAFIAALIDEALRQGADAAETFSAVNRDFEVEALEGEIDKYSVSRTAGVGLRVLVGGRNGYAYTERTEEPALLVGRAIDNANCLTDSDEHPMQTKQTYRAVQGTASPLEAMREEERIALALRLERDTLAVDSRVKRVSACGVETAAGEIAIRNTLGLDARRSSAFSCIYVEPVIEDGGEVQTGFAFRMGAEVLDTAGCAREAVEDALSRLNASPVPSGTYRILLRNAALADLLKAFSGIFSAEAAQKGMSLLNGREGEQIAADCLTVTDDPFNAVRPRAFDGEGTPCTAKKLIDAGRLTTLLHNLKTAKKAGCETTGNASRPSAASQVGVAPSMLVVSPGTADHATLLKMLGTGLEITDLQGLHAGLNAVSGDFSLKAIGRRIENGVDVGAVSGITLAGNFLTLLKGIEAVGSDRYTALPSGSGGVICPSVLIDALTVAGK